MSCEDEDAGVLQEPEVVDLSDSTENIGGKEPSGKPAAIGRWTFQTKKVRDTLLPFLEGRVLNPFAGETRLSDYKRGITEVRNDLNPERPADYHVDAAELGEMFDEESFDVIVLDPPFDQTQSEEHYDGLHARDMGTIRRNLAPLVRPGGTIVEFGWDLWGAADYFDEWERDEKLLFRRAIPSRQPILMVVDRRINQQKLVTDGGRDVRDARGDEHPAAIGQSAAGLITSYPSRLADLPAPEDTWLARDLPGSLQEEGFLIRLQQANIVHQVGYDDDANVHHWQTDAQAYEHIQAAAPDSDRGDVLPCGHTGFRNRRDDERIECLHCGEPYLPQFAFLEEGTA